MAYSQSVELINKILNLNFKGMHVHRINEHLHSSVKEYYTDTPPTAPLNNDDIYCVSFDGKGVPFRFEKDQPKDSKGVRLGKGQKRGTKKEVTVAVNYMSARRVRSSEEVMSSFFILIKNMSLVMKPTHTSHLNINTIEGFFRSKKRV